MAEKYPHRGSYAAFLSLSALLFVLVMLVLWFWLRERKPVPVHTSNPQSSRLWEPGDGESRNRIRASAPIPA
jgi:hypothetical protein